MRSGGGSDWMKGEFLKGLGLLMTPRALDSPPFRYIGKPVPRREGRDKVTGRARYVDDIHMPGEIHGKTVRSTIAAGRIKSIEFLPGIPWNEFTIVDYRDVQRNIVALIVEDQPVLVESQVRHHEEPILLIAHADKGLVEKAVRSIRIEYDVEQGVFDMGKGAIQKEYNILEGDVDAEFAASEVIFERTYETGAQEHVYIEPNGFLARWEGDRVILNGSHQCPYYVHKAVKHALDLKDDQLDVLQETTGGGFGGKEDFPSVVAIHAALLSRKAGRPVRMIYDRNEDMVASTKRHPSRSRVKVGCMKDGTLRALEFEFHVDGGAYVTLSPVVLSRGIVHSFGPYRWPAARLHGRSWMTNSPPYGAFRGFGAPQSLFAIEQHMNLLAVELGMDPLELRKKNFIKRGDMLPTGQELEEEPQLDEMIDRAAELIGYRKHKPTPGKGFGFSAVLHGTGFTGSGEDYLKSKVTVRATDKGEVEILVSSTEIGQGTETVFCQIAAEALDTPIERVHYAQPQTSRVPNSGPTVASRTCSIVGRLVQRASLELKERLGGHTVAEYVALNGGTEVTTQYRPREGVFWDDVAYKGSAYGAYSWMVTAAEVTVCPVTAAVKVDKLACTVDIGRVIHPVLAIGQVEGAVAQAAGWATTEHLVLKEGRMANGHMTNYIIPTSVDAPTIKVEFFERPYEEGAFGAKGVGELPMDGPGPSIAAAVHQATGCEITAIPVLPETIYEKLEQKEGSAK